MNHASGPPRVAILRPFDPAEAIRITKAAMLAGKSERTIRNLCRERHIGRRIAGQWAVSVVALDMLLAGDDEGLDAYLAGDRSSARVVTYYTARSIPPPAIVTTTPPLSEFSEFAVAEARDT
jgi:hypothetical protein